MPNIEFALIIKKRTVDILLNDIRLTQFPIFVISLLALFYQIIKLVNLIYYDDSVAAITVLPRLDNPDIFLLLLALFI